MVAQLISLLALRHHVALLCLRFPDELPVDDVLKERCAVIEEVGRPLLAHSPWRLWRESRRLRLLIAGAPPWVIGCSVADFWTRLGNFARDWQPEVVQIEYAVMGQYAQAFDDLPLRRILVDLDVEGPEAYADTRTRSRGLGRFRDDAWARYRASIMGHVDAVVVLTERDEAALRSLTGGTRIARIPLAVEPPPAPLDPLGRPPPSLLFVGSYSHPPNVEAARRLVDGIFPRLRERHPELVLYLVGENPPPGLTGDRVVVTGRVPDVTPYLDAAAVVAAPLGSGGGMRVKVLEALAAGKPLVASSLAIEGLDLVSGQQVLVAGSDAEFADAISALLGDDGVRAALAVRARAWAVASLAVEHSVQAYEALYDSLDGAA
jgi:glycosyltransferase involved in cell wall biosynthesis